MRLHEITEPLFERIFAGAKPYPFEFVSIDNETHDAAGGRHAQPIEHSKYAFDSENGLHYIVHLSLQDDDLRVSFTTKGGRTALNGAGDAYRVLATVADIGATYIAHDPPFSITFTAKQEEKGRVKLYRAMCERASTFFPGYKLVRERPFGRTMEFTLERIGATKKVPPPRPATVKKPLTMQDMGWKEPEPAARSTWTPELDDLYAELTA